VKLVFQVSLVYCSSQIAALRAASDIPFSSPPLIKYYYMGSKKFGGSRTFPKCLETVLET